MKLEDLCTLRIQIRDSFASVVLRDLLAEELEHSNHAEFFEQDLQEQRISALGSTDQEVDQ